MTTDYTGTTGSSGLGGESTGASEQARHAAGTAADETRHVAGVAQDEAKRVASEARTQLHGLLDQTTREVDEQSRTQKGRLAESMRTFGDDLDRMSSQGQDGMAAQLTREVAERARSMSSYLDQREPRELLDDVRNFARRKPGTFLLGALAAGVVAGRLTRGAKQAHDEASGNGSSVTTGDLGTTDGLGTTGGQTYAADVTSPGAPMTTGLAAPSSGPVTGSTPGAGTSAGTPLAGTGTPDDLGRPPVGDPLADPLAPGSTSGPGEAAVDPSEPGGRS
jgi:hypothetical protein